MTSEGGTGLVMGTFLASCLALYVALKKALCLLKNDFYLVDKFIV